MNSASQTTGSKGLTSKQEKFAVEVASGKSQSDAYRDTYDARRMKPSSVNVQASKMMSDPKIAHRVAELRKPVAERAQVTLESHLERLHALSSAAEEAGQYSAAITAEIARGKAAGLYVEKLDLKSGSMYPKGLADFYGGAAFTETED